VRIDYDRERHSCARWKPLHRQPGATMSHATNKLGREFAETATPNEHADEQQHGPVLTVLPDRPRTRGECPDTRPCPWVGCKYHLYLDVRPHTGTIKLNFPGLEPWELPETCVLDVADRATARGECTTLQEVGDYMNVCRERVRQVQDSALEKLRAAKEELE